ncbi:hypothetical protein [Hymenobacter aquaticus]|uniref:hypothetical protein n=1 Tax=Hymenobacter aquaticus TaxID=1867101 RepID=UPI001AEC118A|nr:hypothetical protein [Hymenobacter aquaticus]
MKKSLILFCLALLGSACQHKPALREAAPAPAAVEAPAAATARPAAPAAAPALTAEMRTFLQQNDLSALWQNKVENRREYPAFSGFFGADHYRIGFVFSRVTQDAQRPEVFHVQGKNQFKKVVTPFEGTLTVTQIADLDSYMDLDSVAMRTARAYTVTADFVLRENPAAKTAGVFRGTGHLDLYRTADGTMDQLIGMPGVADKNPTKGSGLLFAGEWTSNSTGRRKPVLLANDVFVIAPAVLKDFGIGERGGEINPKYAKLGWTAIWENEEWWAEPGSGPVTAQAPADSL